MVFTEKYQVESLLGEPDRVHSLVERKLGVFFLIKRWIENGMEIIVAESNVTPKDLVIVVG